MLNDILSKMLYTLGHSFYG